MEYIKIGFNNAKDVLCKTISANSQQFLSMANNTPEDTPIGQVILSLKNKLACDELTPNIVKENLTISKIRVVNPNFDEQQQQNLHDNIEKSVLSSFGLKDVTTLEKDSNLYQKIQKDIDMQMAMNLNNRYSFDVIDPDEEVVLVLDMPEFHIKGGLPNLFFALPE